MSSYKHFATISSQVYFCSSPIRLDSYNRCQFGCTYCFSRSRSFDTSRPGLTVANPAAFSDRMARVSQGKIQSAFDEFLAARVPIQLGGLQDPFGSIELKHQVTLELLRVLCAHKYPTIISTKSTLPGQEPYLSLLAGMNVLVRFSAAGVREEYRRKLELGCPALEDIFAVMRCLSGRGVAISLRVQPVIPGHEDAALDLAKSAATHGARHISFEYLKIGTEEKRQTLQRVSSAVGTDIWSVMRERGVTRVGRDYTLKAAAKSEFVRKAKQFCHDCGVKFGAGDTEFIHLSDGSGCCNGSDYFLSDCTQFRSNLVGVVSGRTKGEKIYFSDLERHWQPTLNVHEYLTTNSRGRKSSKRMSSWMALLAHRWNGGRSVYSPPFFYGIGWTGAYDKRGYKIYEVQDVF
jgi:DNA repair photolyase